VWVQLLRWAVFLRKRARKRKRRALPWGGRDMVAGHTSAPLPRTVQTSEFEVGSRATIELRPLFVGSTLTFLTESLHRRELAVCA
jgi:hypothetical protein